MTREPLGRGLLMAGLTVPTPLCLSLVLSATLTSELNLVERRR